ncbi:MULTISPECIES: hypothetical protein [unclassified Pedobacter]|uniref:hypothetical protein n=1 Tax=unclassified Pedobacter TaxID=2628915 RepID=UPI001E56AF68|nr:MULTISPECIES: hypothetical protein [unclassified Pedobacter]
METLTIEIPDDKSILIRQVLEEFGAKVISSDTQNKTVNLSPQQEQEINSSQKQIKEGLFTEHSEIDDEVEKWLKK